MRFKKVSKFTSRRVFRNSKADWIKISEKIPFWEGYGHFLKKLSFLNNQPYWLGFSHRGCGCYNSYTIDQKVDITLHVHLYTGFIFTWTSLTTSWSSASAIALIFGLAVKLEKSEKQPKIFSIKKGENETFKNFNKVLMISVQLCHSKISHEWSLRQQLTEDWLEASLRWKKL